MWSALPDDHYAIITATLSVAEINALDALDAQLAHLVKPVSLGTTVLLLAQSAGWFKCQAFDPILKRDTPIAENICLVPQRYVNVITKIDAREDNAILAAERLLPPVAPPILDSKEWDSLINHVKAVIIDWLAIAESNLYNQEYKKYDILHSAIIELNTHLDYYQTGFLTKAEQDLKRSTMLSLVNTTCLELNLDIYLFNTDDWEIQSHLNYSSIELFKNHRQFQIEGLHAEQSLDVHWRTHLVHLRFGILPTSFDLRSGEFVEFVFSIYDSSKNCPISHQHIVTFDESGRPVQGIDALETLFLDVCKSQIGQSLYLVCSIYKLGSLCDDKDSFNISKAVSSYRQKKKSNMDPNLKGALARQPFGYSYVRLIDLPTPYQSSLRIWHEYSLRIHRATSEKSFSTYDWFKNSESNSNGKEAILNFTVKLAIFGHSNVGYDLGESTTSQSITRLTGISKFVQPGLKTNASYITLCDGNFPSLKRSSCKNIKIVVQVRNSSGRFFSCMFRGEPDSDSPSALYSSAVYLKESNPTWNETFRIDLPPADMETSHIFLTFENMAPGVYDEEGYFAFAFLPLAKNNHAIINDGIHTLKLYKYEVSMVLPQLYLSFPAGENIFVPSHLSNSSKHTLSAAADAISKLPVLRDTMQIKTFLFSSLLTQDVAVVNLINWKQSLFKNRGELAQILADFSQTDELEIVKFFSAIVFALIEILATSSKSDDSLMQQVARCVPKTFDTLSDVLGSSVDPRFKEQLAASLESFVAKLNEHDISTVLCAQMNRKIAEICSPACDKQMRKEIKVWPVIFDMIVLTSTNADEIKSSIDLMFGRIERLMVLRSPDHIMISQALVLQQFSGLIEKVSSVYSPDLLVDKIELILESVNYSKANLKVQSLLALQSLLDRDLCSNDDGRFHSLVLTSIISILGGATNADLY